MIDKVEPRFLPSVEDILNNIDSNHYLQPEENPLPICKGCFNVGESCGTPCAVCKRYKAWVDKWEWVLILKGVCVIWRRK